MISAEKPEPEFSPKKGEMPFLSHMEELRWCIIKSLAAVFIAGMVSFIFADHTLRFLIFPLGETKLHFTDITGSFYAYLKVSFFCGIVASSPIIIYQVWKFIAPGLYARERKVVVPLVSVSSFLFLIGAAFSFFVVLPLAISFLVGYGEGLLTPIITVSSYISFAGFSLLGFGLAFQLPIVGYFMARLGLITAAKLSHARPYALVVMLAAAAILTPPDVFTQLLLAGPLYLLYEVTIVIVRITSRKREASDK
jgi:sec-independent protein translocase protein TatC